MCNQERDSSLAQLYPLDFGQFIFRFFCGDAMDCEPSFGIIDETEVLAGLLDRNNIHEAGRVGGVGADFPVYFDKALHNNGLGFAGVESILQSRKDQRICLAERMCLNTHRLRMKTMSGIQSRSL